ncbi:MAG: hypothetical protein RLY86_1974 [Pseudomonadota bacterium]
MSMTPHPPTIFHMCRAEEWADAQATGAYPGSSQDRADGFIHFSTAAQLPVSAAKHRAGQTGLLLLTVDAASLGPALRWEPSRGGQLFPHLYGPLPVIAALRVDPLPLGADALHLLPPHVAATAVADSAAGAGDNSAAGAGDSAGACADGDGSGRP